MTKLDRLAQDWGMTVQEMLESTICDSVAPAICTTPGCDYSTEMEKDQRAGWCEVCNKGTVASCLILAGVI